jgi:DNA polymerase-1
MKKLLLIDGNSIMNRGFYGLPDLTNGKGLHTNAILGFLNIFFKVYEEEHPDSVCVAFDLKQPTFRHEMFAEYKGTRKPMADELREQFPVVKELLSAMHITLLEKAGYEADDILGTLAKQGEAAGYSVTVLSGDRDLLQLATEKIQIRIPKTKAGGTIMENYFATDVQALYGVSPVAFIDMKGLMGDQSDNIPGVPGIGEKTAGKIIAAYGSIENALLHIDEVKPDKARKNLDEYREQALLSKTLATIKLDCELPLSVEDMALCQEDMFNPASHAMLEELEFKSILNRFQFQMEPEQEFVPEYQVCEDMETFLTFLADCKPGEAVGLQPILSGTDLLGASFSKGEQVLIVPVVYFITEDLILSEVKKLLSDRVKLCILDFKEYIDFFSLQETDNLFDCQVAAYLLNPLNSTYDYSSLLLEYKQLRVSDEKTILGKKELNPFSFQDEDFCKVFAYKAYTAEVCSSVLMEKLKTLSMDELYQNMELPCEFALHDMERFGIRVDRDALQEYGDKLKKRIDELTVSIYEMAGESFNINSTRQLGTLLFEKLGLKSGKKTKSGYSTSVEVLEKLKDDHPIIPAILEYRQLTKLNSTYVEGLSGYIREDGRIHGKFNQTVTATGRISSTEPNLQNIPMRMELGREIRKVFIPEDGYVFLDADYSQIELRVLAHISNDQTLIDAYNKSLDIHAITASEVFGVPLEEVDSKMRREAKAVNFGIVYGISSFGLGQDLDISRKDAQKYIDKYFATYQDVKKFLDHQVEEAKKEGMVRTLFQRIRPIPELKSSNFMTRSFGERVAMNSPIQGTAADIIKIAMIHVREELLARGLKSRLILQIHDELLIETHVDEIEEVKEILTDKMMHAASLRVPLYIDLHEGASWYDAK